MDHTFWGVTIMLAATSMTNVGAVLQKKAVDRLPPFDQQPLLASVRAVLRAPLWLIGWLLASAAILLNMIALGLADLSLIQPLNGFGLVVLAVCSRLLLGERLGGKALAGIATVIAGVVALGLTVLPSRVFASPGELLGCYTRSPTLLLGGLWLLAILGLTAVARRQARLAGLLFALAAAACSVAGLVFAKGFFGLVTLVEIGPTFALPAAYPLLGLLLAGSIAALLLQQLSFQKGRAVVVTPAFAAASVALPLLPGRIVFAEGLPGPAAGACALILLGVVLLGSSTAQAPRET